MKDLNNRNGRDGKERIDEYNQSPNLCKFCHQPILAPYGKKLRETKIKKFCSHSCAAKFNNRNVVRNEQGPQSLIEQYSDEEIIEAFNNSNNITEFSKKLGYKSKMSLNGNIVSCRLQQLGLNIENLKTIIDVSNLTKAQLFDRYTQWQTARSAIAKGARQIFNNSSKPKKCAICGYERHYEVCHIKAVSDFDDNALIAEINNIDNLIALCPNHHWEYDNGVLDISSFIEIVDGCNIA